jgi:hypothetical protein
MGFAGRENENDRYSVDCRGNKNENELCGEGG